VCECHYFWHVGELFAIFFQTITHHQQSNNIMKCGTNIRLSIHKAMAF
jgi:hypothetical protein